MTRFSSHTGYKAFNDAIPTSQCRVKPTQFNSKSCLTVVRHLREKLSVRTAIVSNGDSRIRKVFLICDTIQSNNRLFQVLS